MVAYTQKYRRFLEIDNNSGRAHAGMPRTLKLKANQFWMPLNPPVLYIMGILYREGFMFDLTWICLIFVGLVAHRLPYTGDFRALSAGLSHLPSLYAEAVPGLVNETPAKCLTAPRTYLAAISCMP